MGKIEEFDVAIIGAGVIGAALARELSRYQLSIALLEKENDVGCGTSKANSGIVHSGIHEDPGSTKGRLCIAGNRLYPALAGELDVLYQNNGSILVAKSEAEFPVLESMYQNGIANGLTGIESLNRRQLLDLEPHLSPELAGGLLVPGAGTVVPFDLVFALVENALDNGVQLRLGTEVVKIETQTGHFIIQTRQRGVLRARYMVNAAGLYGAMIAGLIGDHSFTIAPRKGEEYLLDRRLEGLVRRTVFPLPDKTSKGILIIPTVDGNIMIGPTAKSTDKLTDDSTSSSGWQEIFENAQSLVPSLRPADLITSFAGIRAVSPDEDFILRPSPLNPRFIHAAGIASPGLTAAPAIALELVELLREAGLILKSKQRFNPERKLIRLRQLNREEQAELMERDRRYANIVCRCELVSEAEIRTAIRRGATTVDGVKLRTRAGMGRCQGGFCTPRIIQILSEELGIDPTAVRKKGPCSELLTGWLREKAGVPGGETYEKHRG